MQNKSDILHQHIMIVIIKPKLQKEGFIVIIKIKKSMIFTHCFIFSLILATPVFSQDKLDMCPDIKSLAHTIMDARQNGMPYEDALKKAKSFKPQSVANLAMGLVADAYALPLADNEHKQATIEDFSNTYHKACIERFE